MSQSHEPSYYEIALTNRQVVTVFVVLLVCVVAAFFSGVWIGRRGAAPGGQERVAELAPSDEAAEAGAEPVKELRFFSDEPRQPPAGRRPAEVAAEPRRATSLREDLASQGPKPPIESPAAEGAPDAVAPASGPPAKTPAATEPARQPGATATAAATSPKPARVATKAPAPDPAAKPPSVLAGAPAGVSEPVDGDVVIQVFFSSDEEKAQALVERLGGSGYPAFLSPVRVGVQTMYRVRVGPYSERAEAEAIASRVQRAFKLDTWITQ